MIIKDTEQTRGCRLLHPAAMDLISDRMDLNVKRYFLLKLRLEERNIIEVLIECDDGLKRVVTSKLAELNDKLKEFYIEMEQLGARLSDEVLISEAKQIVQTHAILLPKNFNFSLQWLLRWKRKRDISQTEMHGEAGSACLAGIELWYRHLPGILREFKLEDIYNLEDTVFLPAPNKIPNARVKEGDAVK